jgi:hypothetical protein
MKDLKGNIDFRALGKQAQEYLDAQRKGRDKG